MFERFDEQAKAVVHAAQHEARSLQHDWIGTEHLLLALVLDAGPVSSLLARHGCGADEVRSDIVAVVGRGRPESQPDVLLATLGIDLGEVRRRVESAFGPEAIRRVAGVATRRRLLRRRRRCPEPPRRTSALSGAAPLRFAPRVKHVLEIAARHARDRPVSPHDILIGILDEGEGVACVILSRHSVDLRQLAREAEAL